jgi:hypothetical protein
MISATSCTRSLRKTLVLTTILVLLLTAASLVAASTAPCATPEHKQFDFWLGNWKIGAPGSSATAHSTVTASLDQCLIVENWDGGRGHSGQNLFGYSADDNTWYGMFADNEGRVHVFTSGKVSAGTAEFEGTSRGSNGETVLNRVTILRHNPNRVEQIWQKSTDNGKTWNTVFSGEYSRANQ